MGEPDVNDSLPLIELVLFFSAVFTKNNLIWHRGAIKAQRRIGGYGRRSHMINTALLSLHLQPLFFFSLLTTFPPNQLPSPSKQICPCAHFSQLERDIPPPLPPSPPRLGQVTEKPDI